MNFLDISPLQNRKITCNLPQMSTFLNNLKSSLASAIKIDPEKLESTTTATASEGQEEPEKRDDSEKAEEKKDGGNEEAEEKLKPAQLASKMFGIAMKQASKASSKLQEQATNISAIMQERTIIGNIEKERQKFIGELQREGKCADDIGMGELLANPEAQKHIIAISANPKNLTEDPPVTVNLEAAMVVVKSYAQALFELDPRLKSTRFELVPKQVSEEKFWRNYTYRISLIRKFLEEKQPATTEAAKEAKPEGMEGKNEVAEKVENVKKGRKSSEDDEEQLEKELLNDLDSEFEMVASEGKKEVEDEEELDKEINALLEKN